MLTAHIAGAINLSEITRFEEVSLFREDIIVDAMDSRNICKHVDKQMFLWASENDEDKADECYNRVKAIERPWELIENRPNLATPEELMNKYAEMFPEELEKED